MDFNPRRGKQIKEYEQATKKLTNLRIQADILISDVMVQVHQILPRPDSPGQRRIMRTFGAHPEEEPPDEPIPA